MTHHVFAPADADAKKDLVQTLASGTARRILFMRTKHQAKKLAKQLTASGIPAVDLHGNLSQPARDRNLAAFGDGRAKVLVATDVAARGVHVDGVELVVHVDPPVEHKAYLHRSGRTARAGSAGDVVTIMLPEQRRDTLDILRKAKISATPQPVTPPRPRSWRWSARSRRTSSPSRSSPSRRAGAARRAPTPSASAPPAPRARMPQPRPPVAVAVVADAVAAVAVRVPRLPRPPVTRPRAGAARASVRVPDADSRPAAPSAPAPPVPRARVARHPVPRRPAWSSAPVRRARIAARRAEPPSPGAPADPSAGAPSRSGGVFRLRPSRVRSGVRRAAARRGRAGVAACRGPDPPLCSRLTGPPPSARRTPARRAAHAAPPPAAPGMPPGPAHPAPSLADVGGLRHTGDDPEEAPMTGPDAHDVIRVRGARENNLKNVDLDVPKRRLTVFTGVSGSGKSSLVFGTIAAESQRLINETYPTFVQQFMGELSRPDVDALENLSATIRVDQERMAANARSTVGTATDVHAMLRVLFSRLGQPHVGSSQAFSFNVPSISGAGAVTIATGAKKGQKERRSFEITGGMCPECEGLGQVGDLDLDQLVDASLSLNAGAILVPGYTADGWMVRVFSESGFLDPDKPVRDFTPQERDDFFYKEQTKVRIANTNMTYEGLVPKITKSMLQKDRDALQPHVRAFVDRAATVVPCPACEGTRLNDGARSSRIGGVNIADAAAMQITDLAAWVGTIDDPSVAPLVQGLRETLDAFVHIGLGYLSLDRSSGTLSGGEAQRTKMIRHLGSSLSDITYVFDEPTAGLHPHDIQRMNETLLQLRDKGNTVLVVEHKPEVIDIADHVVDLGPRAGREGGVIQFEGDVAGLRASDTLTGRFLDHRAHLKDSVREATGALPIRGASQHNLRGVDVDIPRGVLTVVTGSPAPASRRSSTATSPRSTTSSWSTRPRSRARGAAAPRPTPASSTRCGRRSPRRTGSSRRCSAPTARVRAPHARASASS